MSIREKALKSFLDKYKHTAEQGTQEWLNARRFRIGGSEISTILGKNPYSNEKKLIKQHVGLDSFKGYPATWFGTMMEPILTDFINNHFNCTIYETGAINTDKNLGYSPDGLAIIHKNKLTILDNEHHDHIKKTSKFKDNHDDEDLIILFEFKCPYKRVPHLTEVPEYYLPQPLLGMEIINICEIGIFIEAIYRFCSFDDLQYNNKYNTRYHNDKELFTDNPIYYGFILVTYNIDILDNNDEGDFLDQLESTNQSIRDIENYLYRNNDINININNKIIKDLGKLQNTWLLNQIIEHIIQRKQFNYHFLSHDINHKFDKDIFQKDELIKNVYNYGIRYSAKNEINKIINNLPENEKIIGVLPYKLFNLYIKPVNKQVNFITDKVQQDVDKVINIIKECCDGNKTIDEKEEIIDTYYPAKRKKIKVKK